MSRGAPGDSRGWKRLRGGWSISHRGLRHSCAPRKVGKVEYSSMGGVPLLPEPPGFTHPPQYVLRFHPKHNLTHLTFTPHQVFMDHLLCARHQAGPGDFKQLLLLSSPRERERAYPSPLTVSLPLSCSFPSLSHNIINTYLSHCIH